MPLPTAKQQPLSDIDRITMLLYGPPKVGKSTFCSRFPNAFFLATEPGLNHLETFNLRADTWDEALAILADLEADPARFAPIVIDTVDKLWDFCVSYTIQKNKVETISDLAYGKGYALAFNEFSKFIQRLVALKTGIIFVSHHTYDEITQTDGTIIKKFMPSVSARIRDVIMPLVDVIAFATVEYQMNPDTGARKERRILHTQPGILWEAGDRTGRLPTELPFAYRAYQQALEKKESKS